MANNILSLPPEIFLHILSFLPVQSLLRFGQTSRTSHHLATSSLHTLSLGIFPNRISSIISELATMQYPQPKETSSAFSRYPAPLSTSSSSLTSVYEQSTELDELFPLEGSLEGEANPHKVTVIIPDAHAFDYKTLLDFHASLTMSILTRHGSILRNLDLTLWTLTPAVAKTIGKLSALKTLSLRIEDFPRVRAVPRGRMAQLHAQQTEAWTLLAKTAAWAPRLTALRVEGGEMSTSQLSMLLRRSRSLRELWLCKCGAVGKELWLWLGTHWEDLVSLQILGVVKCGGALDETALDAIGTLESLRVSRPLSRYTDSNTWS